MGRDQVSLASGGPRGIGDISEPVRVAGSGAVLGEEAREMAEQMRREEMDLVEVLQPGNDEPLRHAEVMGWLRGGNWGWSKRACCAPPYCGAVIGPPEWGYPAGLPIQGIDRLGNDADGSCSV